MADKIGPCQKERSKICFGKVLWKNGRNTNHGLCPYGEKLKTHKGDGLFFLIFCHRPLPNVGKFQGILNSLWPRISVKYFLSFSQKNLSPEKTETN